MLIQFNFKNYKSFRDDTTLDLTATKETELPFHVRREANENILPVAVIYGANASGKSNVQEALDFMCFMVLRSFNFGEESKEDKYFRPTPFLFDAESKDANSSFEVYFTFEEKTFNYGFVLDGDGVVEEWLNYRATTGRKFNKVFYRDRSELDLDGIPAKQKENLKVSLNDKTLLVSLGAKLKVDVLRIAFSFFAGLDIADFGVPIKNYFMSTQIPKEFVEDENVRKDVIRYFSSFDESIVDFRVEEIKSEDDSNPHIKIEAGHRIAGTDEVAYIPLGRESAGTLKMFALYPYVKNVLKEGGVLFIDELNARLHPLLVRTFVQSFVDPETNVKNAQLIFTSHDAWQLNNGTLRRDEIWFTDKNDAGASQLYSLADFVDENGKPVRNDENYEKNYLVGKYGGVPSMKAFKGVLSDEE